MHAAPTQLAAQVIVIAQGSVVDKALVLAGVERMCPHGRYGALRRHPGMPDAVGPGHGGNVKAGGHIPGQAHFVDFDAVAPAHHSDAATQRVNRSAGGGRGACGEQQDRVRVLERHLYRSGVPWRVRGQARQKRSGGI